MKQEICKPQEKLDEGSMRSEIMFSSGYLTVDTEGAIKQWGPDNRIYLSFKPDLPSNILCSFTSAAVD